MNYTFRIVDIKLRIFLFVRKCVCGGGGGICLFCFLFKCSTKMNKIYSINIQFKKNQFKNPRKLNKNLCRKVLIELKSDALVLCFVYKVLRIIFCIF